MQYYLKSSHRLSAQFGARLPLPKKALYPVLISMTNVTFYQNVMFLFPNKHFSTLTSQLHNSTNVHLGCSDVQLHFWCMPAPCDEVFVYWLLSLQVLKKPLLAKTRNSVSAHYAFSWVPQWNVNIRIDHLKTISQKGCKTVPLDITKHIWIDIHCIKVLIRITQQIGGDSTTI